MFFQNTKNCLDSLFITEQFVTESQKRNISLICKKCRTFSNMYEQNQDIRIIPGITWKDFFNCKRFEVKYTLDIIIKKSPYEALFSVKKCNNDSFIKLFYVLLKHKELTDKIDYFHVLILCRWKSENKNLLPTHKVS